VSIIVPTDKSHKKLRVLASAFTCCPPGTAGFKGGEDALGWNVINQIARVHETWVITTVDNRESLEGYLEKHPVPNLNFHYIDLPRQLKPMLKVQGGHQLFYLFWQIKAYFVAKKLHKRTDFELFHHVTYANDWMASFIGALLPIPYIKGPGGGAHKTPLGFESEYSFSGRIWEKFRGIGQWLFRHEPFFMIGQSKARSILVCNWDSWSAIPEKYRHKTHIFPVAGITNDDFITMSELPPADKIFRVLSVGSLIQVKAFPLAIRAFKMFSDRTPNAEFTIIGSGPEEPRLRLLIDCLKLGNKVHLVNWAPHEEVLKKMSESDVFFFPSLRDGGATVVVEALGSGNPVVCLDVGGPGMLVTDDCGFKIKPKSPSQSISDCAEALEKLYTDEPLRIRLGLAGRRRALDLFTWDYLGDQFLDLYQHTITGQEGN